MPKMAPCSNSWSFSYAWLRMYGSVVLQPQGSRYLQIDDHRLSREIDLSHQERQERHAQIELLEIVTS
jgi:hypothetical protein